MIVKDMISRTAMTLGDPNFRRFPKGLYVRALNDAVDQLVEAVGGIKKWRYADTVASQWRYPLPSDCKDILAVRFENYSDPLTPCIYEELWKDDDFFPDDPTETSYPTHYSTTREESGSLLLCLYPCPSEVKRMDVLMNIRYDALTLGNIDDEITLPRELHAALTDLMTAYTYKMLGKIELFGKWEAYALSRIRYNRPSNKGYRGYPVME